MPEVCLKNKVKIKKDKKLTCSIQLQMFKSLKKTPIVLIDFSPEFYLAGKRQQRDTQKVDYKAKIVAEILEITVRWLR